MTHNPEDLKAEADWDVLIVGAGPAGSAAALRLAQIDPRLAERTLLIEKAVFPRPKLCGGGVTRHATDLLERLGGQVDVPFFRIDRARLVFQDLSFTIQWPDAFRVVRREQFDTALARHAVARGVSMREGEAVLDVRADDRGVTVHTGQGVYYARVVIGADGANSVVRQRMGLVRPDRISRLLEVLTPVQPRTSIEFKQNLAVFDFTPLLAGVQGYYWDFPSIKEGTPLMNRGVFDSRVFVEEPRANMKAALEARLLNRGLQLSSLKLMGHPERWFDERGRHAVPRVVLAGDAAGTEPLLGEGISHALDFGIFAADEIMRALTTGDVSFRHYARHVARSPLGKRLRMKRAAACIFYGQKSLWKYRLLWHACRLVFGN